MKFCPKVTILSLQSPQKLACLPGTKPMYYFFERNTLRIQVLCWCFDHLHLQKILIHWMVGYL